MIALSYNACAEAGFAAMIRSLSMPLLAAPGTSAMWQASTPSDAVFSGSMDPVNFVNFRA